jgi:hypothetical protein
MQARLAACATTPQHGSFAPPSFDSGTSLILSFSMVESIFVDRKLACK